MIKADTPNLWEIRRSIGEMKTKAVIVYSLAWLACFINVERNLTEIQIGEIANDVIEEYGYLKVEEVKYILKQAAKTDKIFGRLDYNVVMGWFEAYAAERVSHCVDISSQEETQAANEPSNSPDAVTFEDYRKSLAMRAQSGDGEASAIMKELESPSPSRMRLMSAEERHDREVDFKRYYYNQYLNRQNNNQK